MKEKNSIRVLQATVCNDKGGLTGYICQNYNFIDKDKIQFDFITYDKVLDFEEDFRKKGANFYRSPKPQNIFKYYKFWRKLQSENKYKIVHFHMAYTNIVPIIFAKLVGIENIILHAHSTQIDDTRFLIRIIKENLNSIGKFLVKFLVKKYLACSDLAAKWMFPKKIIKEKKYILAHNAIDLNKYLFNETIREKKRKELHIPADYFCMGHVGRFTYQKNHEFLVDIFKEIHSLNKKTKLLLIGNGPLVDKIKEKVMNLNLEKDVIFLGNRKDVFNLYSVMDCFVLPSRFEGLGIVVIEAQTAGLHCYVSDVIPKEVKVTELVEFLSLNNDPSVWAKKINVDNNLLQESFIDELKSSGYDINNEIKVLEKIYIDLFKR